MCLTAKNFGLQQENINISKPQGKTTNKENGMGYHRKREKDGGRTQCFMKKEDNSLIDLENVETTGETCCHLSSQTPLPGHCVRSSE